MQVSRLQKEKEKEVNEKKPSNELLFKLELHNQAPRIILLRLKMLAKVFVFSFFFLNIRENN